MLFNNCFLSIINIYEGFTYFYFLYISDLDINLVLIDLAVQKMSNYLIVYKV